MQRLWLVLLIVIFVAALAMVLYGAVGTEYQLYSEYGKGSAPYTGSDPQLIREFSFS